ncbi:MAG TPA: hypothetical protein DEB39_13080, partial [Planctomycetaceae bacterium]|nr:hypothetical protein [Planctomycetaceae bacterium]
MRTDYLLYILLLTGLTVTDIPAWQSTRTYAQQAAYPEVTHQTVPDRTSPVQTQPVRTQPVRTLPSQMLPVRIDPSQTAPRQTPPNQMPPKSINGIPVNPHIYGGANQPALPGHPGLTARQTAAPQMTTPQMTTPQTAAAPTSIVSQPADHDTANPYGLPSGNVYPESPRIAMNQPHSPATDSVPQPAVGIPNPGYANAVNPNVMNPNVMNTNVANAKDGMQVFQGYVPIAPFRLSAEQETELDTFLEQWEQKSSKFKQLDIDFTLYYFDGGASEGIDPEAMTYSTKGVFKYVAPDRILYRTDAVRYAISVLNKRENRVEKLERNRPEEKFLFDGKAILKYDFAEEKVHEYPVPVELQGKGIAESPLPLIFGAKKDDMKNRYWMRIITDEAFKGKQVWLEIRPRWREDMAEFSRVEVRIDVVKYEPIGVRKVDINGKSREEYGFRNVKINPGVFDWRHLSKYFEREVPLGWQKIVEDYGTGPQDLMNPAPGVQALQGPPPTPDAPSGAPKPYETSKESSTTLYDAPEA